MKVNIVGIALIGLLQPAQTVVPKMAAAQILQEGAGAEGTPIRRIIHQAAGERVTGEETRLALAQGEVEDDVRRALAAYRSQLRRAALLTDASGGGRADLLSIAEVAYDTGEMESIGRLDAWEALSAAEIAVARIQSELWINFYDLERAIGGFGDLVRQAEDEE